MVRASIRSGPLQAPVLGRAVEKSRDIRIAALNPKLSPLLLARLFERIAQRRQFHIGKTREDAHVLVPLGAGADDTHPHRVISELAALDDADLTLLDKARWAASPRAVDVRGISKLAIRIDQQFESIDNALKKTEADGDRDGGTPDISKVVVSVMKALTDLENSLEKLGS